MSVVRSFACAVGDPRVIASRPRRRRCVHAVRRADQPTIVASRARGRRLRAIFHASTARQLVRAAAQGVVSGLVTLVSIIFLGFFLGMRHATDADHVIAVSTIVSRERTLRSAILIGRAWGVGHTLTIVGVGGALILFSVVIPPRLGLSMEMAVGLMLIVLGMWNLTGILKWLQEAFSSGRVRPPGLHTHVHSHGDYGHSHPHAHDPESHGHGEDETPQAWLDRRFGRLGAYQVLRPLVVGIVHGLAGSAAIALLVLATIQNAWWATAYLLLFGLGTIAGMMLVTAAIAAPFAFAAQRLGGLTRYLRVASGLLSLGFGLFLVYQIGFVNRPFTGPPNPFAPPRPALTQAEEAYARGLWKIHDDVKLSAVRMTFAGLAYKTGEIDRTTLKARVDAAHDVYARAEIRARELEPPQSLRRVHTDYLAAIRLYRQSAVRMAKLGAEGREQHLLAACPLSETASKKLLEVGDALWPGEYVPN